MTANHILSGQSNKQKRSINKHTLFYCGIGRTDFPGGNFEQITDSIRNRLYHLPDDTRVIAGHGADTTIGFEKKHNHYIPAL